MLKYFALVSLCCSGSLFAADFVTGQAARAVIGQQTFTSQNTSIATTTTVGTVTTTTYSGASNTVFGGMGGLAFAGNTLFVTDANRLGLAPSNDRVLIFNNARLMVPPADTEIPPNVGRCPVCVGTASVLLGDVDSNGQPIQGITQTGVRQPAGVASDGNILVVADTSNNRVLIWRTIPTSNRTPADLVLGQPNFTTVNPVTVTATSLRGPQGVWLQNGKLFVADTQNNRILIWNSIPTRNNQPADLVLGQPNFTSAPQVNQIDLNIPATAATMLSPTSVTSDGTRLIVSDLGFNRVLIWNRIPTTNQQPADLELGQLNFTQSTANDTPNLCASNGTDASGNPTYPVACADTLSFPRFALSDGVRLFVADGGNDRVLIWNTFPTQNRQSANVILGQPDEFTSQVTSGAPLINSASNVTPTPTSLAWDGTNLYVADPTDYRILVFTPETPNVPSNGIVNAASRAVYAAASITVTGTIREKDTATVTIGGTAYVYTVLAADTIDTIAKGITAAIDQANNGLGDPNVFAFEDNGLAVVELISRKPGLDGNNVTLTTAIGVNDQVILTPSGTALSGGASAGQLAAGTLLLISGANLSDSSDSRPLTAQLPVELANTQVYVDGMRAPLYSVTPTEIGAQLPWEAYGSTSVSVWVRTKHADGSVTITTAVGVPVPTENPGLFACNPATYYLDTTKCDPGGQEPRAAIALHASSFATGTVSVDGTPQAGDLGQLNIGGAQYFYTAQAGDTLESVRDAFIEIINADTGGPVSAAPAANATRIRLTSKVAGAAGSGIPLSTVVSTIAANTSGALLTLTATNTAVCCFGQANTPLTPSNPGIPGETIVVYGTGLGLIAPEAAHLALVTGGPYTGPPNEPRATVFSNSGGSSGTVISASMKTGQVGMYEIALELGLGLLTNPQTQLTISQNVSTSNIVTVPIGVPGAVALRVAASSPIAVGTALNFTVSAYDANNNPVQTYLSGVHITSSDGAAVLPADATLFNGVGTFAITFKTSGQQTITATDTGTASTRGTSGPITVQ